MTNLAFRHQRVQRLRRLLGRRSVRRSEGAFVLEGAKLLGAALDSGAEIESVYVDPAAGEAAAALVERAFGAGARVFELAPGVLERVADTVTPQPLLTVVRTPSWSLDDIGSGGFVVVCVDVRDPGNAGAVIRAADAAGADAVVCCEGTADPWNPKTVRASAGSVLHLPVVAAGEPAAVLEALGGRGLRRMAAATRGGVPHSAADLTVPLALVLGNEASGLPAGLRDVVDAELTIPMAGRAESLNVATAAAVLCFEVRRQRSNLHAVEESP
ncbi:MAG: TrmH family RNA methyltransferase [Acidimicrobiales bacterium]